MLPFDQWQALLVPLEVEFTSSPPLTTPWFCAFVAVSPSRCPRLVVLSLYQRVSTSLVELWDQPIETPALVNFSCRSGPPVLRSCLTRPSSFGPTSSSLELPLAGSQVEPETCSRGGRGPNFLDLLIEQQDDPCAQSAVTQVESYPTIMSDLSTP